MQNAGQTNMASKPFTFLAGAAIGAAVAVWLLNTEKGKEFLGKAADWADKALDKAGEVAGAAKEKASDVAKAAKETAAAAAGKASELAGKAAEGLGKLETELSK